MIKTFRFYYYKLGDFWMVGDKEHDRVWLKDEQNMRKLFPINSRIEFMHNGEYMAGIVLDDRIYAGPIKPGEDFRPSPDDLGVKYIDHQVCIKVIEVVSSDEDED